MRPTNRPGQAILVTGTDLNVGKTYIATGLARMMKHKGIDVGVMKPIEVGWPSDCGEWPIDSDALRAAAEVDDPIEDIAPYIFEEMVAPQVAADIHQRPIDPAVIKAALDRLRSRHDVVLVEGAGGIAVPIDDGYDLASLAADCDMPVLVVANAHVGTLNHTFLTVHYAKSRGLRVIGIVSNHYDRSLNDESAPTNARMMQRMCKVPVLGVVPFRPDADTLEEVTSSCSECFDLAQFLQLIGLNGIVPG
jgi:dethiobiotin synthetase